jgi:erythromycin esterase
MMSLFARLVYFSVFATGLVLSAGRAAQPDDPPARVAQWVKTEAIRLIDERAGHGFDDLAPLAAKLEGVEVVALGEDTHGSREVFQMKHRLVEFLVSELGYSLFAIEANMPEARRLNDYVLGGDGDPVALIRGMYFWTWKTEEVREMVEWMRYYNARSVNRAAGRTIEFTGFDMQTPDVAADIAREFIAKYDQGFLHEIDAAREAVRTKGKPVNPQPVDELLARWRKCEVHIRELPIQEETLAELRERAWARQNARIVIQGLEREVDSKARDAFMAENVMWLRSQNPGTKIVLWAHNAHVAKRADAMGGFLAKQLGSRYAVFGFASGNGTYRSRARNGRALGEFPLAPPAPDSVEQACASAGLPRFILDLRQSGEIASPSWWFNLPRPHRMIGAMEMVDEHQYRDRVVGAEYDFLIWLAEVRATVALP